VHVTTKFRPVAIAAALLLAATATATSLSPAHATAEHHRQDSHHGKPGALPGGYNQLVVIY
jgi:hypothetical protein